MNNLDQIIFSLNARLTKLESSPSTRRHSKPVILLQKGIVTVAGETITVSIIGENGLPVDVLYNVPVWGEALEIGAKVIVYWNDGFPIAMGSGSGGSGFTSVQTGFLGFISE